MRTDPNVTAAETAKGTVARVLELLEFIARSDDEFGIKDLAQALSLPQSTVHRLLSLLIDSGFAVRSESRRYRIGPQFLRMARVALDGNDFIAAALGPMQALADVCGETCLLGAYHKHSQTMSFVARVDSTQALRYHVRMNSVETLAWGASGRSILAFLSDSDLRAVLAQDDHSPSSGKRLIPSELKADLAEIRDRGYARSKSQRIEGAIGISAPVFDPGNMVLGSLSVTIPELRFKAKDEACYIAALLQQSRELSIALGHSKAAVG